MLEGIITKYLICCGGVVELVCAMEEFRGNRAEYLSVGIFVGQVGLLVPYQLPKSHEHNVRNALYLFCW